MNERQRMIGTLREAHRRLEFIATRVGEPGCLVRLEAADQMAAVEFAIQELGRPGVHRLAGPQRAACAGSVRVTETNTTTKAYRASKNRRAGRAPDACPGRAAYLVDGKPLCLNHAGQAALKILMGEGLPPGVKPPPPPSQFVVEGLEIPGVRPLGQGPSKTPAGG